MNLVSPANEHILLNLINLLRDLATQRFCGCVQGKNDAFTWQIYFNQGKVSYATHSIAPYERVKRHLYCLSHRNLRLISVISTLQTYRKTESLVIFWLVERHLISMAEAKVLIRGIAREVIESLLLLPSTNITYKDNRFPLDCEIELPSLLAECQSKLQDWQALLPTIESPFQRPVVNDSRYHLAGDRRIHKLKKVLTGFNFRQLAALLNQDECLIAQRMQPLIARKLIVLKAPSPPFDRLPMATFVSPSVPATEPVLEATRVKRKVVCIDDSKAAMGQIEEFLRELDLSLIKFSEPVKALLAVSKIQPDLIFLDVEMPNIDGYSLCSLLRKNSLLKATPIVMVTGYQGVVNQTKANFVGASDYLTKPFTKTDITAMVLKHLNSS